MTTYVCRKCEHCGKSAMIDKDMVYNWVCATCGQSNGEQEKNTSAAIVRGDRVGAVRPDSEFRNFVDKIHSVRGANDNLRKF